MKKPIQQLSSDEIRQKILEYLNKVREKARSLSSISAKITDIKKALKTYGISQNEVVINLDHLVQNGWVTENIEKKSYITPKGFEVPSEKRTYKLSDLGLKHFEGSSIFDGFQSYAGINISNINGVIVVGSNNVVRAEFADLYKKLDQLDSSMKISDQLNDEQKLSIHSDIETIKEQLSKTTPDKSILQRSLRGLVVLSSIPGLVNLFDLVKTGLETLL